MNKLKEKNRIKIFIITLIIIFIILIIGAVALNFSNIMNFIKNTIKPEELKEISYSTYDVDGYLGTALVVFGNEEGIEKIQYPHKDDEKDITLTTNGKKKVALDYTMEDLNDYEFIVTLKSGEIKRYTINYELPRIKGNYVLVNGVWVNEPDLTEGFAKNKTRYMYLNENEYLVPGNWITDEAPSNWYDYNNQKWANIYVENNGIDGYYVWIPRYVYKLNSDTKRSDIKFVNTYNEYIDASTGTKYSWEDLKAEGYQLPEAFQWKQNGQTILPGYWISKHQLSELGSSYTLNYSLVASKSALKVSKIQTNTTKTIASYTYALNGQIVHSSETAEDYSIPNPQDDSNTVNITALDENGEIVGSMTKEINAVEVNKPDLSGFNKDTTFYVYWDENGTEHSDTPISQDPPKDWYNYTYANWANVVTKNNGLDSYFVWIPRYQYSLDTTTKRSNIKFIEGIGTEADAGYKIPEAFTFNSKELTGYWISKYQLSVSNNSLKSNGEAAKTSSLDDWMNSIRKMETADQTLGLNATIGNNLVDTTQANNLDVHMQLNTEYGALVILSASSYGNSEKVNDGDTTTGNEYGVVMKINNERVAAGSSSLSESSTWVNADSRYKNPYGYTFSAKRGDAMTETAGWYGGTSQWVINGGNAYNQEWARSIVRSVSGSIFSYNSAAYTWNGGWKDIAWSSYSYASRATIVMGEGL